jgi:hypothetical protein
MEYIQVLRNVEQGLFWLDLNARRAIELKETFTYPVYDTLIRAFIQGTDKVRCYKVCLDAVYFEFIMTLMRMYDNYKYDTICFQRLFAHLSTDFIQSFESNTGRIITPEIQTALEEFKSLKGSHLIGRLKTVRHNMFAHTSTDFNRNEVAEYGQAEELLEKTLPMLNGAQSAIRGKPEPYDKFSEYWKLYAVEFWQSFVVKDN